MRKIIIKICILLLIIFVIVLPWITIRLATNNNIIEKHELKKYDAVIIFGAYLSSDGQPTEILKERLNAGIILYQDKKVEKLVVSNTSEAAEAMKNYLIKQGIEDDAIELDEEADNTPDSCKKEKSLYQNTRNLIFISQGYHLPRLLYQCKKVGIQGVAIGAEKFETIDKSSTPVIQKYWIRSKRHFREALLDWLVVLGIYR